MNEPQFLARLSSDIAALQHEGLSSNEESEVYRALLSLAVVEDCDRATLVASAVAAADACGAVHLRILSRLIALTYLPRAQRAIARELSLLLAPATT